MKKFIEVYDDIIPSNLSDYLENYILTKSNIPFNYVENLTFPLNHPERTFKPGIVCDVLNNPIYQNHPNIHSLMYNILYRLCAYKNIIVNTIPLARVFIDLPTPNAQPDLPPHIDSSFPHWVCLYYVNDSDGDTIFFSGEHKEIKRVTPKKGRIAFFDGSILHCPTPSETKSRAVVNFNFTPYL